MYKLKALAPKIDPRTYRSPISKRALNRNCCGYSYGHLIFASSYRSDVLIADLFSPAEFRVPPPPRGHYHFDHGILTAPPSSSSCMLFLICSCPHILCWRFRAVPKKWLVVNFGSSDFLEDVTVFNGKLHVLHYKGELFSLEFVPRVNMKRLPDAPHVDLHPTKKPSYTRLMECDGELLMMCLHGRGEHIGRVHKGNEIELYRIDRSEGEWVRIQSIGDWCLFMDFIGRGPLACRNPEKWGGESNCIYVAGSLSGRWSLFPLDGTVFEYNFDFVSYCDDRWPSTVWVYPSMLL